MAAHRYAVGDRVELRPRSIVDKLARGTYTIERLLPNEAADREYRVRNAADGHERVVQESSLIIGSPLPEPAVSH